MAKRNINAPMNFKQQSKKYEKKYHLRHWLRSKFPDDDELNINVFALVRAFAWWKGHKDYSTNIHNINFTYYQRYHHYKLNNMQKNGCLDFPPHTARNNTLLNYYSYFKKKNRIKWLRIWTKKSRCRSLIKSMFSFV